MSPSSCHTTSFLVDSPPAGPPPVLQPFRAEIMNMARRIGASCKLRLSIKMGFLKLRYKITQKSQASVGNVAVMRREASFNATHFSERYGIYSVAVTKLQ